MKIDNEVQLMQLQMMTQTLKAASTDSKSFNLILKSMLNAMTEQDLSGLNSSLLASLLTEIDPKTKKASASGNESSSIEEAVKKASVKYGIDQDLIMAVIKQESSFDSSAVSSAGAMGLMQLMPGTAQALGVSDPFDVEQNVDGGTKYLSQLMNMYGNSKKMALAAYNAGAGTLDSRAVHNEYEIKNLPAENREYVNKVMDYYEK